MTFSPYRTRNLRDAVSGLRAATGELLQDALTRAWRQLVAGQLASRVDDFDQRAPEGATVRTLIQMPADLGLIGVG